MRELPSNNGASLVNVLQTNPSKTGIHSPSFSFLALAIISVVAVGFAASVYFNTSQSNPEEVQATNSDGNLMRNIASTIDEPGKSYDNCLAYGSGESVTITCPTYGGYVYKAILQMPKDLAKDFSESVFSIRGVSLVEDSDGSVTIQYQHKDFRANFFAS